MSEASRADYHCQSVFVLTVQYNTYCNNNCESYCTAPAGRRQDECACLIKETDEAVVWRRDAAGCHSRPQKEVLASLILETMRMNHDDPEGQKPPPEDLNVFPQTLMNLTLLDPPRWGWSAVGGVADLLTPHEVSFRVLVFITK